MGTVSCFFADLLLHNFGVTRKTNDKDHRFEIQGTKWRAGVGVSSPCALQLKARRVFSGRQCLPEKEWLHGLVTYRDTIVARAWVAQGIETCALINTFAARIVFTRWCYQIW